MTKIRVIIQDALILFAVSTCFVLLTSWFFSTLEEKSIKTDPLISVISQEKVDKLKTTIEKIKKEAAKHDEAINLLDEQDRTTLMHVALVNYQSLEKTKKSDEKRAPMVPVLIDLGVDVNARDQDGWTALMWASWSGLPKVAEELIKAKADVNIAGKRNYTPLSLACMRGNLSVVEQLLKQGADKKVKTSDNKSCEDLINEKIGPYKKHFDESANYDSDQLEQYKKSDDYKRYIGYNTILKLLHNKNEVKSLQDSPKNENSTMEDESIKNSDQ